MIQNIKCFPGDESVSDKLRLLCAADLYLYADEYAASFDNDDCFGMAISGPSENIFTATSNRRAAVEHEAVLTCKVTPRPRWSSLIHLQALANILRRPVLSIYPENTGFHYRYLFNRQFDPLTSTPKTSTPIYILWTVDGAIPHGMFTPNHFVVLREKSKSHQAGRSANKEELNLKEKKRDLKRSNKTLFDYNFQPLSKNLKADDSVEEDPVETDSKLNNSNMTQSTPGTKTETSTENAFNETVNSAATNNGSKCDVDPQDCNLEQSQELNEPFEKNQPRNISFPKRQYGVKNPVYRRFQKQFFDDFPWLHYNEQTDRAFCHECICANHENMITSAKIEQAFISEGYANWKEANQRFKRHEESECHKEAVLRLNVQKECKDVVKTLTDHSDKKQEKSRKSLLKIISNIRFLARQGLPLRGADDDENSNFNQLNLVRCEVDTDFRDWLEKKRLTYDSPQIQNEIINIMCQQIVRDVAEKVRESEFYSILADETTDVSNREQLVICLRWVEKN